MDFFKQLQNTGIKNVSIDIIFSEDHTVSIALVPKSFASDSALKVLKPITLSSDVNQMDKHFFETIYVPLKNTQKFYNNVEQYEAQREETRKKTEEAKSKKIALKKAKEKLSAILDNTTYDPLKDKVKTFNAIEAILSIDPLDKFAQDNKTELQKTLASPSLF